MNQLESVVTVETPEQVSLSYTVAGIGSRVEAAIIDSLCITGLMIALWGSLAVIGVLLGDFSKFIIGLLGPSWILALVLLLNFGIMWGYYVLFEGLRDGQTPGKKRRGIRVVQDGGYSVTFSSSAIRNIVRILDMFSFIGLLVMLMSKSGKRIGDFVAGTFVVRESTETKFDHTGVPKASQGMVRTALTDEEYVLLERYVARRQDLPEDKRSAIASQLEARFKTKAPPDEVMNSAKYLMWLFAREREARSNAIASRTDTGSTLEQQALTSFGIKRWNEFSEWLARARSSGLSRMPADDVSEFVSRYREVSADLARLQTAARGREIGPLFFLSRLVAAGHNVIYKGKRYTLSSIGKHLIHTLPAEVRRSFGAVSLAAALLFVPGIASYIAVYNNPDVASEFIPLEMQERARTAAERAAKGEGYVKIDEFEQPVMASAIITNNVRVTYGAFVLGITAGIGTVLMLVFNGVQIGGGAGLFASEGMYDMLLAFVAPHGVLELFAISIAGGGGLLLASALLIPGALTRRDALVLNGRRAIRLVILSTIILVVAGTIEGLISPLVWPLNQKLAVSLGTVVLLVGYLSLGWRSVRPESYNPDLAFISR